MTKRMTRRLRQPDLAASALAFLRCGSSGRTAQLNPRLCLNFSIRFFSSRSFASFSFLRSSSRAALAKLVRRIGPFGTPRDGLRDGAGMEGTVGEVGADLTEVGSPALSELDEARRTRPDAKPVKEARRGDDALRSIDEEPGNVGLAAKSGLGRAPRAGEFSGLVEKVADIGEWRGEVEPENDRCMRGAGPVPSPMSMPMASPCGSSVGAEVRMSEGRRFADGSLSLLRSSPSRIDDERDVCRSKPVDAMASISRAVVPFHQPRTRREARRTVRTRVEPFRARPRASRRTCGRCGVARRHRGPKPVRSLPIGCGRHERRRRRAGRRRTGGERGEVAGRHETGRGECRRPRRASVRAVR